MLPDPRLAVIVAVDCGLKDDWASVVVVARMDEQIWLVQHRIWKPSPAQPLNLKETIEQYLVQLHRQFWVVGVYYDPYQLVGTMQILSAQGMPVVEFPQTVPNLARMGQTLFDLLRGGNLRIYPDEDLRQQALNTTAIESPRGFRIAKVAGNRKIDSIIALAMACVGAVEPIEGRLPLSDEEKRDLAWQEARVMSNLGFPPPDRLSADPNYVVDDTGRDYQGRNMSWYRRDAAGQRHDLWTNPPPEPEDDGMGPMMDTGRA